MGCSSSALNKAGDSSRFGSGVTSNENSSTVEHNKFCVDQPKPCTPGGEAAFHGNTQRESHPSLERPKASVVPTANGVKSYHQPSLANDETPGKARTEVPSLKGDAEIKPLRLSSERDSPGAPQAGTMKFLQTAENILPLETTQELPPKEATGKGAQPQILEAIPKENSSPEIEGIQSAESSGQQQLVEAPGEAEQPQALETVLKENETSQMPGRSQPVPTPVMNKSPCEAPDGLRNAHEPQVTGGNRVQPAETGETAAKVEMAREIHPDKEEQHIEGETGEKVEAEMKNEKESEEAETKEKETGEAVDLGAAGAGDRRA